MPTSSVHFFIEQNAFAFNTPQQSFGPQSIDAFNLTTKFNPSGTKKAFSICKGVVLVQPGSTADKVNVILRPYKQPFSELTIKYFVYRGLNKSDFFTGNLNLINTAGPSSTDFVNKIQADYESFYQEPIYNQNSAQPIAKPIFTAKFIGYNEDVNQVPVNTPISDFFFKESQFVDAGGVFEEVEHTSFELPMIDGGKWLGNFSGSDCGVDVVLNYGDYKQEFDNSEFTFDLQYARQAYAQITLLATDSDVVKKLKREQTTQFIDIVAFYGLFVKEGKVTFTDASNAVTSRAGQAIFNDLLAPFATKNKVYLYIDSNRNRSYNYYNNYCISQTNSNSIKVGLANALLETAFGNLNWPLHVFELDQSNSNDFNDISIQVIASSTYEEIGLFVLTGDVVNESDRGFIVKKNLLEIQNSTQDLNFSKVLSFKVPNIDANGQKKNISSIIRLIYVGNEMNFSSSSSGMLWEDKKRYLLYHNIFSNITTNPVFNSDENFLITSVNKPKLISYKGFSNLMNESLLNNYVVFQQGKKNVVNADLSVTSFTKEKSLFIAKKIATLDNFSIHKPNVLSKGVHSCKMNVDSTISEYSNYLATVYGSKDYLLKHYLVDDNGMNVNVLSLDI